MKKAISLILAAIMLISVLSVTAMAANGPNPAKNELDNYSASIFFYNTEEDGGDFAIFNDNEVHNNAIEGATYDLETNTLTLVDFNHPNLSLSLNDMGDDFKLNIIGECVIYGISSTTETYGGSLTVTGTGVLTVNPERQDEVAVNIFAEGADSTLHIDNTVGVKFLSCFEAVMFQGTAHPDKDTVFTQGEDTVVVEGGKPVFTENETVDGAYVENGDGEKAGYRAHQANDPDYIQGVFCVNIYEDEEGKEVYHVERYKLDEKMGIWVKDKDFEDVDLNKDDFDSQYIIETQPSNTPKEVEYTDETGEKKTGYLMKQEGDGGVGYFVIDIDFNEDPSDDIHRAKPVELNDDGTYSLVMTWGGYEVNASNYRDSGLEYVYGDEYVDFYEQEILTDEFDLYVDKDGNKYVIIYNDNYEETIYRIDEDNKIEIDGKEYYILMAWQGVTRENLELVTKEVESDYYDYEYTEEDYIYTPSQEETGETETAEATEETADATEEPTEDSTGGEIVPPTTEGQIETAETQENETEPQPIQTDPIVTAETAAPTAETTVAPTTEAPKPTKATDPTVNEIKPGTPEKSVDKFVTKLKTEKDAKGTTFGLLCARQKKATKKSVTVKWNKLKNAKSYIVYGAKCGTKKGEIPPYKKIKTVKGNSYTKKGLKKGTYFKFIIVALDKNKKVIASSKTVHIATKGGKVGNDKTVKVNKTKVTLKVKKTFKIKGKEIAQSKKLKVKRHRKLRYESSNTKVAKVSGKGKITAKKKGTAYIYVYAQNGLYKKVKVTVK